MKKPKSDELRTEYRREDLGKGVRGKHLKAYQAGSNLVLLDPKVAAAFQTEQAVNEALSGLIEMAEHVYLTRNVREDREDYRGDTPRQSERKRAVKKRKTGKS